MTPTGFPDEKTLHGLVEQDPYLLPLAGGPRIAVVGSEVRLGAGWADLLAVEEEGRFAIIELKLARSAEARRAVVAQVLAYAAELQRLSLETIETETLASHLQKCGVTSLFDAVQRFDQTGSLDEAAFRANLTASLAEGRFRLVLVLDSAPPELVRTTSYLQRLTEGRVTLDLITIASYSVGGTEIVVPQRVDGDAAALEASCLRRSPCAGASSATARRCPRTQSPMPRPRSSRGGASCSRGRAAWRQRASCGSRASAASRTVGCCSCASPPKTWASPPCGAMHSSTFGRTVRAKLQLQRSVLEWFAPAFIAPVEAATGGAVSRGGYAKAWDAEVLRVLGDAYRHAAGRS